ncbi:MAG TPA: response regulator [Planctomycetota bacterium]|nr:response regulator [Planctomycetota bacterium]
MDAATLASGEPTRLTRQHLVVCVDDDAAVLSALTRLLRAEPYEFVPTDSPEKALDLVRTRDVSLFIADYRMPEMSGTGLLQLVKSSSPTTVRLLLTGYPRATWVLQAQERELMHVVFGKPWDNEDLKQTIVKRLHERERSVAG